jgi:hypothetical protein
MRLSVGRARRGLDPWRGLEQKARPFANLRSAMKETIGIRSNIYTLADGSGVAEINPHQVRLIESGPKDTTVVHFSADHSIVIAVPLREVSEHFKHVFGSQVKVWGPDV